MEPNTLQATGEVVETGGMNDLPVTFIKKSHKLIFSQLRLTPIEHDMFALFLARLKANHWDSFVAGDAIQAPCYKFNNEALSKWFEVEVSALYSLLKEPSSRLIERSIGIEDGDSFQYLTLFKKVQYKNGDLTLVPNDLLMNEFLGVSHGHAQVPHRIFRRLRREYSKRLYTIFCRFQAEHTILHEIPIESFYAYLGLLDAKGQLTRKTYSRITELVDRIIKPAIKEIDELEPNIRFEYCDKGQYGFELKRHKRKVVAIKFLFSWVAPENKEEAQERATLGDEPAPFHRALQTYAVVQCMDPNQVPVLEVVELNHMMRHVNDLQQKGYMLDAAFMTKFATVMSHAKVCEFEAS